MGSSNEKDTLIYHPHELKIWLSGLERRALQSLRTPIVLEEDLSSVPSPLGNVAHKIF